MKGAATPRSHMAKKCNSLYEQHVAADSQLNVLPLHFTTTRKWVGSANNLNELGGGFFPTHASSWESSLADTVNKALWDFKAQNACPECQPRHCEMIVKSMCCLSHLTSDDLSCSSRSFIYLPMVFCFRVKSQIISTVLPLAPTFNLVFIHFHHCTRCFSYNGLFTFHMGQTCHWLRAFTHCASKLSA